MTTGPTAEAYEAGMRALGQHHVAMMPGQACETPVVIDAVWPLVVAAAGPTASSTEREHPSRRLTHCPRCYVNLIEAPVTDLAHVFDICDCDAVGWAHVVEQLWHRDCLAFEADDKAAHRLDDIDTEIRDAKRAALLAAERAILAGAANGPAVDAPRLRRAARIVSDLRSKVLDGGAP